MPNRIQLRRTRGWRKPPNCVAVARPTIFGNPFTVAAAREAGYGEWIDGRRAKPEETEPMLRQWCVELFRDWLTTNRDRVRPELREKVLARLPELRGKDLACWCSPDSPCHGDVLIELANRQDATDASRT